MNVKPLFKLEHQLKLIQLNSASLYDSQHNVILFNQTFLCLTFDKIR